MLVFVEGLALHRVGQRHRCRAAPQDIAAIAESRHIRGSERQVMLHPAGAVRFQLAGHPLPALGVYHFIRHRVVDNDFHDAAAQAAQTRVLIDIKGFDLGPGTQTTLTAVWTVKEGDDALDRYGKAQIALKAEGAGIDQLARTQGKAIERLAATIAGELRVDPTPK